MASSDGDTPLTFADIPASEWTGTTSDSAAPPAAEPSGSADSADPSSAATTSPPAEPATNGAQEGAASNGPIPFERHKAILEGERADWDRKWQRVAWADELSQAGATPEQVKEALQFHAGIHQDAGGFITRFFEQASRNPQLAPLVRQLAQSVLGTGTGNGIAGADPNAEPQPDYYTDNGDGSRTPFMSAATLAKWQQWNERRILSQIDQRYGSLIAKDAEREQKAQHDQAVQSRLTDLQRQLDGLRTQPHFKEHEADVAAYVKAQQFKVTLNDAWLHVLTTKVLPALSQTERAKTVAELQTKAHASGIAPSAAGTSTPKGYTSFKDIPKSEW